MTFQMNLNGGTPAIRPSRLSMRTLLIACVVALVAGALALLGSGRVWAQEGSDCEVIDLGTLGVEEGGDLRTDGRWTTEDCDSRFRTDSDAHTYRFEVVEGGRIRINLSSAEGDPYVYLLAEDGSRITDNDDGGDVLDARVERDLAPGVYLIEATTVGGRGRGPADFTLTVSRVSGCESVHLGALEPGGELTATGTWTLDTCGSRFVVAHPAYGYSFELPQDGRVLIDLKSENGDPVLSLISATSGLISANDDGGERRNSRIEEYLQAGTYLIEATTYLQRDLQPLMADFTLTIQLVDEKEAQSTFQLKIETIHTSDEVIVGESFPVNYRVGNLGGGDFMGEGVRALVYLVAPRVYRQTGWIPTSEGLWQAGDSYHTGEKTASAVSTEIDALEPFTITLGRPGPSWVFVAVIIYDESDEEIGFHGIWRNLMVLSGLTFQPVVVEVAGERYEVSAEADEEGDVTVSVNSVADPESEIDETVRAKAIYTAGVRTQILDGIFERPAIAGLSASETSAPLSVGNPRSSTLLSLFAARHAHEAITAGLTDALAAGEAINPIAAEEMVLVTASKASWEYTWLARLWEKLQLEADGGKALTFEEAFVLHAQIAYAERIISPAITAGEIVEAARAAEEGWEDPGVGGMIGELADEVSCGGGASMLGDALKAAGVVEVERFSLLDAELRAALPVYGPATDAALCAAEAADAANARLLRSLSVAGSDELQQMFEDEPVAPTYELRILSRLGGDGSVELGVELSNGRQILPTVRHLPAGSAIDRWWVSSEVEVRENPIGKIRARRLADGRIELGFLGADGTEIAPDIRYLPADLTGGVWFRSGEIKVPAAVSE